MRHDHGHVDAGEVQQPPGRCQGGKRQVRRAEQQEEPGPYARQCARIGDDARLEWNAGRLQEAHEPFDQRRAAVCKRVAEQPSEISVKEHGRCEQHESDGVESREPGDRERDDWQSDERPPPSVEQ